MFDEVTKARDADNLEVAIRSMFFLAALLLFHSFLTQKSSIPQQTIGVKDWISISVSTQTINRIISATVLGMALFVTVDKHKADLAFEDSKQERKQISELERSAQSLRPAYISESQWQVYKGVSAYRERNYGVAISEFEKITNAEMPGSRFVRWQFYLGLSKMQIEIARKVNFESPDEKVLKDVRNRFDSLIEKYPEDVLADSVLYWNAHLKRMFFEDYDGALKDFITLRAKYSKQKWGRWREGAIYYSAILLEKKEKNENVQEAISLLQWLVKNASEGLIRLVDEGRDYRVAAIIPDKIEDLENRLERLR